MMIAEGIATVLAYLALALGVFGVEKMSEGWRLGLFLGGLSLLSAAHSMAAQRMAYDILHRQGPK